jgi:hypothetical protein
MTVHIRVTSHVAQVNDQVKAAAVIAVRKSAEILLQKSKDHVPHDVGTLENSGSVDTQTDPPTASVFYDTPYAIRLHEHPEYHFQGKGRGKWLVDAKNANAKVIQAAMAKFMREGLR